MRFCVKFFFLLFFAANFYGQKSSEFYNIITSSSDKTTFKKQYVFSEKEYQSNIYDVIENPAIFDFIDKKYINQGIYNKNHWVKINLINNLENSNFVFEFHQVNIDSLHLFVVKNKKILQEFKTKGLHFEKNNNESFLSVKYAYLYDLEIAKKDSISLYINAIVNDDPFRAVNNLWTKKHYKTREKELKTRSAYILIFLGLVLLILVLSISMYIFTLKKLYLYYLGFVAVIFTNLLCLRSFISPLIIEKYFFLGNNYSEMFGYVQIFFILLYTNEFFSLKDIKPKFYKILNGTAYFTLLLFIAALFFRKVEWFYGFSYVFSKIFMVFISFLLYGLAIHFAFKKQLMAYYYIIAYTPLVFFVGHYILTSMKLTTSLNPLDWELVIFVEIIVLSLAMAHKYFLLMKENSNYQQEIIIEKERGLEAMIDAQETERTRIARELHDGVVQQIGSVILKSRNLFSKKNLIDEEASKELLESLENSNKDLRNISHQMMPRALKDLGIIPALNDLLAGSLPYSNIKFSLEHFNIDERLPQKIEITLYRITQELINNIIKHSKADEVSVQLFKANNTVILIVEDNGVGILSQKNKKGIGLLNITSRLDLVKGSVNFEPSPKSGTLVTIKIPL
jgi:signal transduction histidine kinase